MSHTMNIALELRDKDALFAACDRLGCPILMRDNHKLFSSTETGIGVMLSDWRYPVVVRDNGTVAFDNYNGSWATCPG